MLTKQQHNTEMMKSPCGRKKKRSDKQSSDLINWVNLIKTADVVKFYHLPRKKNAVCHFPRVAASMWATGSDKNASKLITDETNVCCFLDILLVTVCSAHRSQHQTHIFIVSSEQSVVASTQSVCFHHIAAACVLIKNRLTFPTREVTSSRLQPPGERLIESVPLNESNHLIIYHSAFHFTSIFITSSFFFFCQLIFRFFHASETTASSCHCSYSPDVTSQLLFYFRVGAERQT